MVAPTLVARPGRRRADVPVDSTPAQLSAAAAAGTAPYAGRRVAVLEREVQPAPAAEPLSGFGDDTVERVLGALEPVDHTTSFEHEPTERIPLLDLDHGDLASVLVAPASTAGKRRATRISTRRPPILRVLPSLPAMLGVAALAASIGGTLVVHDSSTSRSTTAATFEPASILTGANDVGRVGARGALVTRSSDRQAQAAKSIAAANRLTQQRDPALDKINRKTAAYNKVLASNVWITPITPGVYHLTARFGQYGLWANFHTGLDFAAPTGTPIHAIASGTVTFAQYDGSYGNKTVVTLADGTEIWYAHQNEFGVSVGDTVTQGETIGYVGSTGNTTGPHVHIEVRPGGGDPVDPFPEFEAHDVTP